MKIDKQKLKDGLKELIDTVVFVVVAVIIIRFFLGEIRWIPSLSMYPTLDIKDRIFVERLTRFYDTPKRGDIMIFYPPETVLQNDPWTIFKRLTGFGCTEIAFIKRVVGMPGDKYEIKPDENGTYHVYINNKILEEKYVQSDYSACEPDMKCGPEIIPEKHYLMLGDNRANSKDGRYWGLLHEDRFIGKAKFRFWPLNRIKYFEHIEYNF